MSKSRLTRDSIIANVKLLPHFALCFWIRIQFPAANSGRLSPSHAGVMADQDARDDT